MTLDPMDTRTLNEVHNRTKPTNLMSCRKLRELGYISVLPAHNMASLVLTDKGRNALHKAQSHNEDGEEK